MYSQFIRTNCNKSFTSKQVLLLLLLVCSMSRIVTSMSTLLIVFVWSTVMLLQSQMLWIRMLGYLWLCSLNRSSSKLRSTLLLLDTVILFCIVNVASSWHVDWLVKEDWARAFSSSVLGSLRTLIHCLSIPQLVRLSVVLIFQWFLIQMGWF